MNNSVTIENIYFAGTRVKGPHTSSWIIPSRNPWSFENMSQDLEPLVLWIKLLCLTFSHHLVQALHDSQLLEQLKGNAFVVIFCLWNWALRFLKEYFIIRSSQILLPQFQTLTVPLYHTPPNIAILVRGGEVEEGEIPIIQNPIGVAITFSLPRSITSSILCTQTEKGSSQRWLASHGATSALKKGW